MKGTIKRVNKQWLKELGVKLYMLMFTMAILYTPFLVIQAIISPLNITYIISVMITTMLICSFCAFLLWRKGGKFNQDWHSFKKCGFLRDK